MASPAETSQASQAGLFALVLRLAKSALEGVDKVDARTVARMVAVYQAIVAKYAPAAATLAIRQYSAARLDAGVRSPFHPRPADLPSTDSMELAVEWAINDAVTVDGWDATQARADIASSVAKSVQDIGRLTIITNVKRDRAATAWARIPEPALTKTGTCSFCAMLASRGAVFKKETVGFLAHRARNGGGHDCVCHAEPVFGKYEPGDLVKKYQQTWAESTSGRSGRDARAAFRQAIEGRPVTGLDRDRSRAALKAASPNDVRPNVTAGKAEPFEVTPAEARHLIDSFTATNARIAGNPKFDGLAAWNNKRIAELRKVLA